jgi:hypothetical protein
MAWRPKAASRHYSHAGLIEQELRKLAVIPTTESGHRFGNVGKGVKRTGPGNT